MATVLITGGTGMVGRHLTKALLNKGYDVIILSRGVGALGLGANSQESRAASGQPRVTYANWDTTHKTIDAGVLQKADHIVHLAGAGVADKRWSKQRKKEIIDSRIESSDLLVTALGQYPNTVKSVVSASAIGWYGPDTTESRQDGFAENAIADTAFLGETCRLWEESIKPVEGLSKRLVVLRIGIVLANDGGALVEFMKPLKAGLATILGNGKQVVSWICIDDLCRLFIHAIEHDDMKGVFNAVAPHPVTNMELTLQLAKRCSGKFFIPVYVPAFVLKIMLGEMSVEVLKSATVSSRKLSAAGFKFLHPSIEAALGVLVKQ